MTRSARRRHALIWLFLGPAILIALVVSIKARPPAAISDGPVPLANPNNDNNAKPQAATPGDRGATP